MRNAVCDRLLAGPVLQREREDVLHRLSQGDYVQWVVLLTRDMPFKVQRGAFLPLFAWCSLFAVAWHLRRPIRRAAGAGYGRGACSHHFCHVSGVPQVSCCLRQSRVHRVSIYQRGEVDFMWWRRDGARAHVGVQIRRWSQRIQTGCGQRGLRFLPPIIC